MAQATWWQTRAQTQTQEGTAWARQTAATSPAAISSPDPPGSSSPGPADSSTSGPVATGSPAGSKNSRAAADGIPRPGATRTSQNEERDLPQDDSGAEPEQRS